MRILIADDDAVSRRVLETMLVRGGHEVTAVADGAEAWAALQAAAPPPLAILDWMMPEMDGVEVCRRVRACPPLRGMHLILLTARGSKEHVVEGLRAGANDYMTKPFDREELKARVSVGVHVVRLQMELAQRVRELEEALAQVKRLQGLLPMCAYCKSIRDHQDYWHQVEAYISEHSEARFSHGICPDCWENVVKTDLRAQGVPVADMNIC